MLQGQINSPSRFDWIFSVKEDLEEFKIKHSFEEIALMTKKKFKGIVKEACRSACFNSLLNEKEKLSKGKEIIYNELKTQSYLLPGNNLSTESARWIFTLRSRDLPIRGNFPGAHKELKCKIPAKL